MRDTENLVESLCREFCGGEELEFNGHKVMWPGHGKGKSEELFEVCGNRGCGF